MPGVTPELGCDFPLCRIFSLFLPADTSQRCWGFPVHCGYGKNSPCRKYPPAPCRYNHHPGFHFLFFLLNQLYMALQYKLVYKIICNASLNPYIHTESCCRPDQCPVTMRRGIGTWQGVAEFQFQEVDAAKFQLQPCLRWAGWSSSLLAEAPCRFSGINQNEPVHLGVRLLTSASACSLAFKKTKNAKTL